jgi:hypothetical protein
VLKPAGGCAISSRPAVKRKISEFDEQGFDESQALDENAHLSLAELLAMAAHLVNSPRVASARSKVGTSPHHIAEEVVLDTMIDLRDLYPRRISALTPDEESELLAALYEKTLKSL